MKNKKDKQKTEQKQIYKALKEGEDKIKLTQRQVERQVKKIKGIIFENYKESEDGS